MTKHDPMSLDYVFVREGTPTFADLIKSLPQEGSLPPSRIRDLVSGLNRISEALGYPPSDIPCDSRWLQPRLAKINPIALGMSPKTWQNAISNVRSAMVQAGLAERRIARIGDLNEAWSALWAVVLKAEDPTVPGALLRFVHFLNRIGVSPDQVGEQHALKYREALAINEIFKDPESSYRATIYGWNLARRRIAGWPDTILPLVSRQKLITRPLSDFQQSLILDVDELMLRMKDPYPFADQGPTKPLRPTTIEHYRRLLLRFASEVLDAGVATEELFDVSCLLEPSVAERGLRQMLQRKGNKTCPAISETAALLRNVARMLGAPSPVHKRLTELAAKVAVKPQLGMTPKNRARLRVLQQPEATLRLITLPDKIFADDRIKAKPFNHALAREDALAIAILLVCPIRVRSLAFLQIDKHFHRPGDGRVFLVLEEEDTKTGQPIEFELPRDVIIKLDAHLKMRCPYLCPTGTRFLFPQRDGLKPVHPTVLAGRISKRIHKVTGLEVNAHLFRHFAVMIWLDANPGGYEVARRLMGHSEVSHTINMYSGLEISSATRAFSDLVGDLKGGKR